MQRLLKELERNGIKVVFLELENPGYYNQELKIIFVNQNQSEEEIKRVLYHEMKHALDHSDYVILYKKPIAHLKMEAEANEYMIKKIIEENGGVYNYSELIHEFKISMGTDTKYSNRQKKPYPGRG